MRKQVPGSIECGTAELSEQEDRLRQLALNNHFQFLRESGWQSGAFGLFNQIGRTEGKVKSPDRVATEAKKFADALTVITGKLAMLERDSCLWALHEADKALVDPDYRFFFEYETDQLVPITLIMFEAELALYLLFKDRVDRWEDGFEGGAPHDRELIKLDDAPEKLRQLGGQWGLIDPYAFCSMTTDFMRELNNPLVKQLEKFGQPRDRDNSRCKEFFLGKVVPDLAFKKLDSNIPPIYAFRAEEKELLSELPRQCQSKIACWHLKLPQAALKGGLKKLVIGLHSETEHDYWQQRRPQFCSMGTSGTRGIFGGYGVIAFPGEAYWHFEKDQKNQIDHRIIIS